MFRGNVSIYDVARKARVSPTTVSLILNNRPGPSASTRQLVLKTIKDLQYVPSLFGRMINRKKSGIIGVLVPTAIPPLFPQMLQSINESSEQHQLPILASFTQDNTFIEGRTLRLLGQMNVNGLILATVPETNNVRLLKSIAENHTPIVQVERFTRAIASDYVGSDNEAAAIRATQYLLGRGHDAVGIVMSTWSYSVNEERYEGYRKCLREAGIKVKSSWVLRLAPSSDIEGELQKFLFARNAPRALLWCTTHLEALAVAMNTAKLVNGKNIEIVLFDADPCANLGGQIFLNILQDTKQIGREAFRILMSRLATVVSSRPKSPFVRLKFPCIITRISGSAIITLPTMI